MAKSKKKHESTSRDGITQTPWFLSALERLQNQESSQPVLRSVLPDGTQSTLTHSKLLEISTKLAQTLSQWEVRPGHPIFLDMPLCWELFALWCAALYVGAVPVCFPLDMRFRDKRAELEKDMAHHGTPMVIAVDDPEKAKLWFEASGIETPHILYLYTETCDHTPISELFTTGVPGQLISFSRACAEDPIENHAIRVPEDSPAVYVYTQGSHGDSPRRVPISHAHLRAQAEDFQSRLALDNHDKLWMDLTSPHAVNLTLFAACLQSGSSLTLGTRDVKPEEIPFIVGDLTYLFTLPDTLSEMVLRIQEGTSSPKWAQWRFSLAKFRSRNTRKWLKWSNTVIHQLLIRPIQNAYFQATRAVISYGNDFNAKIADRLNWLDIPVYNAFTVGELGFVHLHKYNGDGGFLKSIEARIKSGLLSVKSARNSSPFIQTGDLVFEDDRCGLCAHRSSPMTLSNGDIVDSSPMRDILVRDPLIEEIFIFGDQRPFLTALIYIHSQALLQWAQENGISETSFEELTQNAQVYETILQRVDRCNKTRAARESIQKIALLTRPLSEDPHILSPCHLTRVREVEHRYHIMLDSFYQTDF